MPIPTGHEVKKAYNDQPLGQLVGFKALTTMIDEAIAATLLACANIALSCPRCSPAAIAEKILALAGQEEALSAALEELQLVPSEQEMAWHESVLRREEDAD